MQYLNPPTPALPHREREGFGKGGLAMPLNGLQSLCRVAMGFLGA